MTKHGLASLALMGLLTGCYTQSGAYWAYNDAETKCRHDAYDVFTPQEMKLSMREHPEMRARYDQAKAQCLEAFEKANPRLSSVGKQYGAWLKAHPLSPPDGEAIIVDHSGNYIGGAEHYAVPNMTIIR